MRLTAKPIGSLYTTRQESDIAELSLGCLGLRALVDTNPNESYERLFVENSFRGPRGFRFLDEGDLIRYWESEVFTHGYHLFEVLSGGWLEQETQLQGMLSVTQGMGGFREWFIYTTNGCINVLAVHEPLVREFK
jgi:hypothetical protein